MMKTRTMTQAPEFLICDAGTEKGPDVPMYAFRLGKRGPQFAARIVIQRGESIRFVVSNPHWMSGMEPPDADMLALMAMYVASDLAFNEYQPAPPEVVYLDEGEVVPKWLVGYTAFDSYIVHTHAPAFYCYVPDNAQGPGVLCPVALTRVPNSLTIGAIHRDLILEAWRHIEKGQQ